MSEAHGGSPKPFEFNAELTELRVSLERLDDPLDDDNVPCTMDAECGNATSGVVCDAAVMHCTPGCRGTGGNGCPTDKECSSKDSSIGSCGPLSTGTGGAGSTVRPGQELIVPLAG